MVDHALDRRLAQPIAKMMDAEALWCFRYGNTNESGRLCGALCEG